MSSIQSAPTHMPATTVTSFGDGLGRPGLDPRLSDVDLLTEQPRKPLVCSANVITGTSRHTTRDAHHQTPQKPQRSYATLGLKSAFLNWVVAASELQSSQFRGHLPIPTLTTANHRSGGPGESHPRAPTDPGVTVSRHRALVILVTRHARPRESMPSARTCGDTAR